MKSRGLGLGLCERYARFRRDNTRNHTTDLDVYQ